MAVCVRCLPCKLESLSLDPQNPHRKLSMSICASVTPGLRRGDKQVPEAHWPASLVRLMSFWVS